MPLNGALDLLRLDILPFQDRIRIGLVTAYLQRVRDWKPFEQVTAESWLRRALGDRPMKRRLEPSWRPFGRYASDIAMVWFWVIWLRTTSGAPASKVKTRVSAGSFGSVIDAIAAAARAQGAMLNRRRSLGA